VFTAGRTCLSVTNADDPEFPRIMVETAHQVAAEYSPGTRRLRRVLKTWTDNGLRYATLYEPTETWRFQSDAADDFRGALLRPGSCGRRRSRSPSGWCRSLRS
jgi:hypothetical protein